MEKMNFRDKLWFISVVASVVVWIIALLMQPTGDPMGGGILNPQITFMLTSVFFIAGMYYYVKSGKPIKGVGIMGLLSMIAFALLAVNWGALLSSRIVRTFTFVIMGLLVILLTLIETNFVSRWKFPVNLFKWHNASWIDLLIGVGSGVFLGLISFALGYSLIGVPIGLVPSAVAGANLGSGLLVGSVAFIENALIMAIPLGFTYSLSGYLADKEAGADKETSKSVATLVALGGAALVVLIAYVFHLGAYSGREFSLVGVSLLFGFWGAVTVFRKNTLAADLSHATYNVLVVLLGVANIGLTLL